jgi:hypothetical protein
MREAEAAGPYGLARYDFLSKLRFLWIQDRRFPSPRQIEQSAGTFVRRGLLRLEDEPLEERTRILANAVATAPEHACALPVRVLASDDGLEDLLRPLDSASLKSWFGAAYQSVEAEVRGRPRRPSSVHAMLLALSVLEQHLSPAEQHRLTTGLINLKNLSDAEACWVARTLYRSRERLEEPHRSWLNRFLVSF